MKDSVDQKTIDIFPEKKRRGRPVTGKAKSDKQRMQEYRLRKKNEQAENPEMTLSIAQFEMLMVTINKLTKERDEALKQLQQFQAALSQSSESRIISSGKCSVSD